MADFNFKVLTGPYEGTYLIDLADLSGTDSRDFRHAIGSTLADVVANGGGDLDVLSALVWLQRRKSNKALPFHAVADHLTYGTVEQVEPEPVPVDPTTPDGD